MTTPADTISDEVWELIEAQIETFGQSSRLTPAELSEFSYRAFRIKQLGEELDRQSSGSGKQVRQSGLA